MLHSHRDSSAEVAFLDVFLKIMTVHNYQQTENIDKQKHCQRSKELNPREPLVNPPHPFHSFRPSPHPLVHTDHVISCV